MDTTILLHLINLVLLLVLVLFNLAYLRDNKNKRCVNEKYRYFDSSKPDTPLYTSF